MEQATPFAISTYGQTSGNTLCKSSKGMKDKRVIREQEVILQSKIIVMVVSKIIVMVVSSSMIDRRESVVITPRSNNQDE